MTQQSAAAAKMNHDSQRHERAPRLPQPLQDRRAALVIAHPGHELRVYQWLKLARPTVFVLTDGSGRSGNSRLYRTTAILKHVGADLGSIYGRMSDAEMYSAIIRRDVKYFIELASELADCLSQEEIDYVVGDALEGYSPAHDLCRYITNAAIMSLYHADRSVDNYDALMGNQNGDSTHAGANCFSIELDSRSLDEKVQIAQSYSELQTDVQRVFVAEGIESLKTERMRQLANVTVDSLSETPYYEIYGRQQADSGLYRELLTYRDHLRPIAEALRAFGERGSAT